MITVTIVGNSSAYPTSDAPSSSYLIETEETAILLDCGNGSMQALYNYIDLDKLNHVYISHQHPDHIADLGGLQNHRMINKSLNNELENLAVYGNFDEYFQELVGQKDFTDVYTLNKIDHIANFSVTFHETIHPVPCYAIRLTLNDKVLVYTADTAYHDSLVDFAKGADLLITEASLLETPEDKEEAGHMSIEEAVTLADKANIKQTVLTHIPYYADMTEYERIVSSYDHAALSIAAPGNIYYL